VLIIKEKDNVSIVLNIFAHEDSRAKPNKTLFCS
jgi:hypothetical protein